MKHELKIWPIYYCRVADGSKTFEVRDNDRSFQQGDTVVLREWDPDPLQPEPKGSEMRTPRGYTGSPNLNFKIGYIHVLDRNQVIFSLLPAPKKSKG